jgi:predicted dehydrogenase
MNLTEAVMVGAGHRSRFAFGAYAHRHPDKLKFIAVAEPDEERRLRFAEEHSIPKEMQFHGWEDLVKRAPLAPLCVNATMDHDHIDSAIALLKAGYHLLLEKPMADTPRGCVEIAQTALELGRFLQISHPLRFTTFYTEVKRLLDSGAIGRLLSISMSENIGYYHFSHSYVRGNWRRIDESGPLVLTKCCHDMDIATWLTNSPVSEVSSQGGLTHFRSENAPAGAPKRCLDGCPVAATCPYYAEAMYLQPEAEGFATAISVDLSLEARRKAVLNGPYGRCVYHCDNDTPDQQCVVAQFANGVLLDFAVHANTPDISRTIRAIGSEGELSGHFEKHDIRIIRYKPGQGKGLEKEYHRPEPLKGGHSGGDEGVISHFLDILRRNDWEGMRESLEIAVEGHLLSFAAEAARTSATRIHMNSYRESVLNEPLHTAH